MTAKKKKAVESCGPQLSEVPSSDWDEPRLQAHVTELCRRIDEVERPLAREYWLLGAYLEVLRDKRKLRRGEFDALYEELGIDKTRASKARAIFNAFPKAANLEGLTVEAAYARRQRKLKNDGAPAKSRGKSASKLPHGFEASSGPSVWLPLPGCLSDLARQAERCLAEAKKAPPANARAMAAEIAATIKKLQALQHTLAAVASGNDAAEENS